MTVGNEHDWEVALRGLQRFFDEGMTVWSKSKFFSLFPNEEAENNDYFLLRLIDLERQGVIAFPGRDDFYIKVLRI
ncbi:hypothetical protein A988_20886 [Pseudomonas syringae BRIP39023]|uniref:hypothetical protein n=1 Tax=Pseudomonas TaxID=286 RepID=UPI0002A79E9A|nr:MULTISPECIES: hypothetical protein [Pseudomonas]ELQ08984.1 hypothetical protein A988_20886 [Pseudomonas syringae BRIP39023]MCJ2372047.1 hypothetical protein [Pseudomonas sp. RGM 3321]